MFKLHTVLERTIFQFYLLCINCVVVNKVRTVFLGAVSMITCTLKQATVIRVVVVESISMYRQVIEATRCTVVFILT